MKIGIFTSFYRLDHGYSLCSVVVDQLAALVANGHKPVLFTLPIFSDEHLLPEGVEVRKVIPQLMLEPYKGTGFPEHWKEDVKKVRTAIEENMTDISHLICHDIFFIDTYLPYNIALREALPVFPEMKVFAWTHSAPSNRPTLEDNPHANRYFHGSKQIKFVYLNHDKVTQLAEMYAAWDDDVRVVHNSRDPRTFWGLHPLVHTIIEEYNLLDADIISVYPLSTPRMISGKGLDKALKIHSKLKDLGYKTKMVVCNAHANAQPEKRLIADTYMWAADRGLTHNDIVFTSKLGPEFELGVDPKVVSDLFRLSNVFIFPTYSENSSLVLLEAMIAGNLLVLNKDVPTLREHAGEHALYMDFSYRKDERENENYFLDLAKIIAAQFEVSKPLQVKRRALQKFNYDAIYKEIEALLYEN